jgi:hypothetical protein
MKELAAFYGNRRFGVLFKRAYYSCTQNLGLLHATFPTNLIHEFIRMIMYIKR